MWTKKQLMQMRVAKGEDKFRDHDGEPNLVARIRATAKKQVKEIVGIPVGSKGKDGRKFYQIKEAAEGMQGPMRLYCSCPAQTFHYSFGHLCKHSLALIAAIADMAKHGLTETKDIILYDPFAVARACEALGRKDMAEDVRKAEVA